MEKYVKLKNRLAAVARYVPQNAKAVDVGTDHGYLPVWLVQQNRCLSVIASDIREGPLDHARQTAENCGLLDKIRFILSDGLAGVLKGEADTVILAGMGGETMIHIIAQAPWLLEDDCRLILQPMSKGDELVFWLYQAGFRVMDECLAKDGEDIYRILCVHPGKMDKPMIPALFAGKSLLDNPLLGEYLDTLIEKTGQATEGIKSAQKPDTVRLTYLQEALYGFKRMKGEWLCRQ